MFPHAAAEGAVDIDHVALQAPEDVLSDADRLLTDDGRAVILLGDRAWDPPAGWEKQAEVRYELPEGAGARRVVVVGRG